VDRFAVARLDDIAEISDGRHPWRPVGHHLAGATFELDGERVDAW
jgi:hypothetical protein